VRLPVLAGPYPRLFLGEYPPIKNDTGASICYGVSSVMGKYLVLRAFPELVRQMNKRIQKHKENLLWYMLFLRITPLVPNWFINVSSPIVGIPFFHFFLATLFGIYFIRSNNKIGLMPANMIIIKCGEVK